MRIRPAAKRRNPYYRWVDATIHCPPDRGLRDPLFITLKMAAAGRSRETTDRMNWSNALKNTAMSVFGIGEHAANALVGHVNSTPSSRLAGIDRVLMHLTHHWAISTEPIEDDVLLACIDRGLLYVGQHIRSLALWREWSKLNDKANQDRA